jgi:hypothetical protein
MRHLILSILLLPFFGDCFGQPRLPKDCGEFGYACGIAGSPQPSMIQTILFVNHSDKAKLIAWAKSDNPQNIAHAIVGLYILKRKGVILTPEEETVYNNVRRSTLEVENCSGCGFERKTIIKNLLTKKNLEYIYNWYLLSGYKNYN